MSAQGFPFDDDVDPFADEGFDPFQSEALVEEEDFEIPPDEREGGISKTFLIAGGVIIVAVLIGICAIVLLTVTREDNSSAQTATAVKLTNDAIEAALAATDQRLRELEATLTVTTAKFFEDSTSTAIAAATQTQQAIDIQLNASRTAIAFAATQTEAARQTQVAEMIASQTPPTQTPQLIQVQITDQDGNPVSGITVVVYQDDGDLAFNPPVAPTPTLRPQPSNTPPPTATSSPTATTAPPATATTAPPPTATTAPPEVAPPPGTEEAGEVGAADPSLDQPVSKAEAVSALRRAKGISSRNLQDGTPPPPPGGDQPIGEAVTPGPGGSFTLPQLEPGSYFIPLTLLPGEYTIRIGDQVVTLTVTAGTSQTSVDLAGGVRITFVTTAAPTPTSSGGPLPLSAFHMTATALAGALSPTPSPPPSPAELPSGGLFSDADDDATPGGLTLLAIMGAGLIAVVVVVRRLRSSV